MAKTIPNRDADLQVFSTHFSAGVTANAVALGFSSSEATTLANANTAYVDAYALSSNDATRTKGTVADKDLKRGLLRVMLASYIARIQANPAVTAQQKIDLNLHVRDLAPTPIPPPNTQPVGHVVGIVNLDVTTQWFDQLTPTRRARPFGYAGYAVYTYVAENAEAQPPDDIEQWRHEGLATRSRFTMSMKPADAGKKIWIAARWYSRKGEFGPLSTPITAVIAKVEAA